MQHYEHRRTRTLQLLSEALEELETLPDLIEDYLKDLPDLVDRMPIIRDYETVGGPEPQPVTADTIRFLSPEEVADKWRAAERERA